MNKNKESLKRNIAPLQAAEEISSVSKLFRSQSDYPVLYEFSEPGYVRPKIIIPSLPSEGYPTAEQRFHATGTVIFFEEYYKSVRNAQYGSFNRSYGLTRSDYELRAKGLSKLVRDYILKNENVFADFNPNGLLNLLHPSSVALNFATPGILARDWNLMLENPQGQDIIRIAERLIRLSATDLEILRLGQAIIDSPQSR